MVSKEKELELINTIKEMLKNGDSEEDIITIFDGFGLDKEYIKELINKAKGKKTIHDFISMQQKEEAQISQKTKQTQSSLTNTQVEQDNNMKEKNKDMKEIKDQVQKLNEKMDKLNEDLEKIKEDVEATRLVLEKLMKIYRSVLNKMLSKYS
jgi:methyl-accepting chemotaxis protein